MSCGDCDALKAELKDRQDATIKLKGGLLVEEAINLHRELRRVKGDVKHQTDIAKRRKVSIGVLKARVAELEARVLPDELHGIRRGLEMAIGQILFMATPEDTISDAIDEIRKLIPGPGSEGDTHEVLR